VALKNPEKFHQITQNHFIRQVSQEPSAGGSDLDYLYKTLAENASSVVLRDWLQADDTAILGSQFERLSGLL